MGPVQKNQSTSLCARLSTDLGHAPVAFIWLIVKSDSSLRSSRIFVSVYAYAETIIFGSKLLASISSCLEPIKNAFGMTCGTGLAGLEPTTYGLGNRRSIRLSYSPIPALWNAKAGEVIAIRAAAPSRR